VFSFLKRKPFFSDQERQAVATLLFKDMANDTPAVDREAARTAFNKLVDDGLFTVTLGDIANYERVIAEQFWRK